MLYEVELAVPVSSEHRKKRVFPSGKGRVDMWRVLRHCKQSTSKMLIQARWGRNFCLCQILSLRETLGEALATHMLTWD